MPEPVPEPVTDTMPEKMLDNPANAHTTGRCLVDVVIQWQTERHKSSPSDDEIRQWARSVIEFENRLPESVDSPVPDEAALSDGGGELTVRVVDSDEMRSANHQWRGVDKATNVLSFLSDFPPETGLAYFGDILICAEVLAFECHQQGKSLKAHWAHIVIHGTLHLLGYDHMEHADAVVMERREVEILATLGVDNPYLTIGESEISPVGGQ